MAKLSTFLFGHDLYVVKAHAVVAMRIDGDEKLVYKGGFLPTDTLNGQIDMLLARGMIAKFEGGAA